MPEIVRMTRVRHFEMLKYGHSLENVFIATISSARAANKPRRN